MPPWRSRYVCVPRVAWWSPLLLLPLRLQLVLGQGADGELVAECWMGALTYETCCLPPPDGNPFCWDAHYTAELCCTQEQAEAFARRQQEQPTGASVGSPAPPPLEVPPPEYAAPREADGEAAQPAPWFGGCEWSYFQGFKHNAAAWYTENRTRMPMFHEFASIASIFDEVYQSCPAAALTALLIKMESVYFKEHDSFYELLDIYTKRFHEAVAAGTLETSHMENGWPLVPGVAKLLELRALGRRAQKQLAASSAGGKRRDTVDVVVCYCSERLVWLRAFHKVPWRDEDHSETMREHVALRLYHKCGAEDEQQREVERQRLLQDWSSYFHTVEVRYVDDAVRADDCSAYLQYVVDYYDNFPEFAVFLHADAPEHIPSLELLTDSVFAAARGFLPEEVGFVHLAHNYVLHNLGCATNDDCEAKELDGYEFPELWKNVFGSSIAPSLAEGDLNAYCCVQFMARGSRMRLRPRSFYERALNYFGDTPESYYKLFPVGKVVRRADTLGRTPCQLAMYIWHVMFGEPLRLPRRQRDQNLPLFMKLVNIEVEALGEEDVLTDPFVEQMVANSIQWEAGPHSTTARMSDLFAQGNE